MNPSQTLRRYGWRPDLPDHRDSYFESTSKSLRQLPDLVDWSPKLPPCYDQGSLGSCTANALAGAVEFLELSPVMPSRLFIYYNERDLEGTTQDDAGAMIRDGLLSLITQGVCPEALWPYDAPRFDVRPDDDCYRAARQLEALAYARVDHTALEDLLEALTVAPVVGGFTVYESFESDMVARTGIVPMPSAIERRMGGHAVLVTGYNMGTQRFSARNSWGAAWGKEGYFTIPFDYFTDGDLADDFWAVKKLI